MFKFGDEKGQLKCSFCGKVQEQVKKLIAGPGVYICDECVELCNEIIEEELNEESHADLGSIPKPNGDPGESWTSTSSGRTRRKRRSPSRCTTQMRAKTSARQAASTSKAKDRSLANDRTRSSQPNSRHKWLSTWMVPYSLAS